MFTRKTPAPMQEPTLLDQNIEDVEKTLLSDLEVGGEDHARAVAQLKELYALKNGPVRERINPNTVAMVAGNVLVTAVIVGYERSHVINSKAVTFLKSALR